MAHRIASAPVYFPAEPIPEPVLRVGNALAPVTHRLAGGQKSREWTAKSKGDPRSGIVLRPRVSEGVLRCPMGSVGTKRS